uniref:Ulp1 protease family, C-terminal catalytic domain containing protein n=1 Tax=Solanum tuberosum TaxID=4113 RepID=M1DFA0_SOLTU
MGLTADGLHFIWCLGPNIEADSKGRHTEDRLKIGILYFITSFLTGSEASRTTIPKLYFDLDESGQYVNFPWGNECFRLTLKVCSHRLGKNPTSFKFSQFHIALQVWFYECCHPFDNTVVLRVSNVTPRILNWKASNESIFFDDLKNMIFRTHGNQHKFRNIVLTDEEINAMDQINLHQSSRHHETEDQATSERHDVDFDEKYVELKKEIAEIVALDPILNSNTTPNVQPRNRNPGKYDTSPYIQLSEGESSSRRVPILFCIKHPFESHNGFEVAAELIDQFNKWVFKDVSSRRGRKSAYSKLKDSFEPQMDFGVVKVAEKDFFNIMVKPGRPWEDGRESNCDMRSISPDHDVGQCIRGFKLLANIPWDSVDDVIIPVNISEKFHYFFVVFRIKLRCLHVYDSMKGGSVHTKKVNEAVGKLATIIPLFFTSKRFYGKRLELYANKLPKYVHKSQSNPLDIKHMTHAPQQEDSSNDCGLYTCLFAEYISNDVFYMRSIDIDAKYHRQRYATILWHYGKTKNEDGAISESEVTGTVASKFGGSRIAKEYVPNTTNYPTSRSQTRN